MIVKSPMFQLRSVAIASTSAGFPNKIGSTNLSECRRTAAPKTRGSVASG